MSVYFIQVGRGPVKIGRAVNPETRRAELQCGHPETLSLIRIIPGGLATERWLHKHFAPLHVRGEWFAFSAEMLSIEPPSETAGRDGRDAVLAEIFDKRGAVARIAGGLGITIQAVDQWKRVPHLRVLEVERLTGVSRHRLRPDMYPLIMRTA